MPPRYDDLERLVALHGDPRVARSLSVDGRPWPRERSIGACRTRPGIEGMGRSAPSYPVWPLVPASAKGGRKTRSVPV